MTQEPKHPHNRKRKGGKHPNWGGRRPGAGAPKGNMNALKHGRRSRQMADLVSFVVSNPKTHAALISIAGRWEREDMEPNKSPTASSPRSSSAASNEVKPPWACPAASFSAGLDRPIYSL